MQTQDPTTRPSSNPFNAESNSQQTLSQPFEVSGIGLHSGCETQVRISPAPVNQGRYFVRTDLPGCPTIPARVDQVRKTLLSTELGSDAGETVSTVEHLLAALVGMGVDNAKIELDGPEVPLLDGSALPWANQIQQAGTVPQEQARSHPTLTEPIWARQDDAFVAAFPAPALRFTYGIDFAAYPVIGNQWHSYALDPAPPINPIDSMNPSTQSAFQQEIAPARTFGFADQIDQLKAQGLIKGGSLENALVCDSKAWINPPLRFSNEPVRHKLLDLLGDLSLLGSLPRVHVFAYKASHSLHTQLAQLMSQALVP